MNNPIEWDYCLIIRETPERYFTPSTMWGHREKEDIYELGSGLSPDSESPAPWSWTYHLLGTVRNKFVYKLPGLW